ncbi:SPOSA6832_02605, partial [Sporobolomyces salmonicolor]
MSSDEFELDDAALGELDAIETAYANGTALPPKSIVNRPGLVQRDLFGGTVVQPQKPPSRPGPSRAGTGGSARGGGGAGETATKVRLSKTWDPASFAKHGWSKKNAAVAKAKAKGKGKGKGRQRAYGSDEEAWDEEEVLDDDEEDDEEFLVDTTYDPNAPILPIKWPPDENAIKTFVYPVQRDKPLRTYQFNIVQRALYNNTLVSLPTGLGKTFIAACVMRVNPSFVALRRPLLLTCRLFCRLNFYRWYPRGKVIFLAPTRPLVTQQIKACHYIAGIPQEDCIELTGGTIPKLRSLGWATKRVIYSTPQTVERDLAKGRLDPRDVTCIVVDEAHRATGDYSYCGVIRYMMCRNPHFRVLALTATPGSKGDAVQEVIDNLHIGRIEVRADDSIDIRQYVHKKSFDLTILPLGPHLSALRDKWGELMKQFIQPLYTAGLIWSSDPVMLAPFVVQLAYGKIKSMPGGAKGNSQYFPQIKTLMMMARAMEYLVIQSVTAFESNLKDIQSAGSKTLVDSSGFRNILRETAALRSRAGYIGHPKMEKLRQMCLEHFKAAQDERDEYTGEKRETRVMIFCNFRAVVEEIVACLNTQWPLIKATPFVGQASSKGVRGKSQKEQLETIKKFKSGAYNVLVATSIGEEGLDIGEIDLIICYEANKSPIRMLQRVGRTGRARDGHIIVLMSAGREERNWDKANDAYNEVQNALTSGKTFDLYVDGERLLPDHVKPVCEKVEIKALPLDIEKMTMTGQSRLERRLLADEKKKEKKVRDPKANVPNDAFLGFRNAGQLAVANKAKPPTASQTMRERKSAALLDVDQEGEFRARWMFTLSGQPVRPHTFSTEDLPFDRGFTGSAHRIPSHSLRHLDLLAAMRIFDQLDDSKPEALDAWHDKHSNAFKPNLVHIFKREEGDPLPRAHPPLRRPPPSPLEEEPSLTYPALTGYPQPSSSKVPALEPRAKDDKPLFLRPSSASASPQLLPASPSSRLSQPASPLPPPPKRRRLSRSPEIFSPQAGLTTFRAAIVKHDPGAVDDSSAAETIDLSNVLSEDDQALPPRPPPPPRPPSTNFSIELDDDDNDMIWSDSELLKGALIRGQAASRSPIALEKGKGKGKEKEQPRPVGPRKSMEIIIDDSDGEVQQQRPPPLVPPAPRKPPSKAASVLPLAKSAIPAAAAPPKPAPIAFRPFVPPRPSGGSQPKPPHRRSSPEPSVPDSVGDPGLLDDPPPPRPARARSSCSPPLVLDDDEKIADDDDYSFFDLPDDAFDACLVNIPQEAVRGRARPSAAPDEIDDSIIMPPPPPSPSPAPTPNPAFRPAKSLAGPPPQPPAPMRRLAVPDTSSSSPAVPTGFRTASALLAALDRNLDADADISFGSTQAPKQLNRLRRGRQLSRGDVDNSSDPPSPPPKKRPQAAMKKKKPKKIALTHKLAAKAGIFDVEAINSDASGAEASSEDYLSENSIDRAFVAREGEDDDDDLEDSPGQAQFYRDSLATQAPPGFAPAFGAGKPRTWADPEAWRGRVGGVAGPVTPATPRSEEPSQWSYDSFCVPDDEDIEYERSSPHC